MNEFLEQFVIESRELVEQASAALQSLERSPRDPEALDELFRALHTLKGSAGIIDFLAMERVLHEVETLLAPLRSTQEVMSSRLEADCFACLDLVTRWIDEIERTGELPQGADAQSTGLMLRLGESSGRDGDDAALSSSGETPSTEAALLPNARRLLEAQAALLDEVPEARFAGHVAAASTATANVLRYCGLGEAAERVLQATESSIDGHDARALRGHILHLLDSATAPATATASASRAETGTRTLRIDAARVEEMVRLVSELTVVKNAIGHLSQLAHAEAHPLAVRWKEQHAVLDRVTLDAQRAVLGMRVLPLRAVFGRFPALMREMTVSLGKPARLIIEGEDTEADKAIVDMLFEPLLHVVRNAMDHGVEPPAVRARGNKAAVATLCIRAARQGDRVLIEVDDDGGGIDVARVGQVAVERGIVSRERLTEMSEAEVIDLVFAPGFSTAATVTELSGRGIGMDAVRTAVGRVGGNVAIESRAGLGTTVQLSLPFSVMMTQVMTVEAGGQTFGIPVDAVVETISVPTSKLAGVGTAQAIVHRDRTLPVFELANLLQVQAPGQPNTDMTIVVTSFAGHWGGIRIDRAGARMEVMLKPLEGLLAGTPGITGTTIMGDGRVLLVLDLAGILL